MKTKCQVEYRGETREAEIQFIPMPGERLAAGFLPGRGTGIISDVIESARVILKTVSGERYQLTIRGEALDGNRKERETS